MTDMGTHVPFVASWKGASPPGRVIDDLIEFTDFYPTLASAAGIELGPDDPIDGRSFLPQLCGQIGDPRAWVLCHYHPYWNKAPGQFARTQDYKLYRDGRFFRIPTDLKESHPLSVGTAGADGEQVRAMLHELLMQCPPIATETGNANTVDRPVYPAWKKLLNP